MSLMPVVLQKLAYQMACYEQIADLLSLLISRQDLSLTQQFLINQLVDAETLNYPEMFLLRLIEIEEEEIITESILRLAEALLNSASVARPYEQPFVTAK